MYRYNHITFASLVLFAGLSTPAFAGTLHVPADYSTIGHAISLAAPGDKIMVAAGHYPERVTIPAGKPGLLLRGVGNVAIDPTGVMPGAGLHIEAPNTRVENINVRHAYDGTMFGFTYDGVGVTVAASATGTELCEVEAIRADRQGFLILADDVQLERCRSVRCSSGFDVQGDDASLKDCDALLTAGNGIELSGDRGRVVKCTVEASAAIGINVSGDAAVVKTSSSRGAAIGIQCAGGDNLIKNNTVQDCREVGIYTPGFRVRVAKNEITSGGALAGVYVAGLENVVEDNEVRNSGLGFTVWGADHELTGNLARRNGDDGFRIQADRVRLVENRAVDNGVDGFDIEWGTGHELIANIARRNHAEGFENNHVGTDLIDNEASKNRMDVSANASWGLFSGNVYTTGGPTALPVID